ncbi:MAG: haloalkane dehalogenase [Gammaproteobacteria bacterium]
MDAYPISADLPFTSKFVEVRGAKMHYIEQGEGNTILFLHGMPTSSYLWRNIIPTLGRHGRCIAPDLIGMGKSDKPDIPYRLFDHIEYVEAFIAALNLQRITLVMHGWGAMIGFDYAMRNEKNIQGLAFYEPHIHVVTDWNMLSLPVQQLVTLLRNPKVSYKAVIEDNYLVNKLLQRACLRELTATELENYRQPFTTPESRQLLWQYIQDLPFVNKSNSEIIKRISHYSHDLQKSSLPKLLMYTIPGFITTVETIEWCQKHLSNLTLVDLGEGLHLVQESNPRAFSEALAAWYIGKVLQLHVEKVV